MSARALAALALFLVVSGAAQGEVPAQRPRAPDLGLKVGVLPRGPLDARELKRLATRALLGMARTGSSASNGSGDYAIAFSTAPGVRIHVDDKALTRKTEVVTTQAMSPLFEAAIEATEEAIYNSMLKATTTTGNGHTVEALPIERTVEILKEHRVIR